MSFASRLKREEFTSVYATLLHHTRSLSCARAKSQWNELTKLWLSDRISNIEVYEHLCKTSKSIHLGSFSSAVNLGRNPADELFP